MFATFWQAQTRICTSLSDTTPLWYAKLVTAGWAAHVSIRQQVGKLTPDKVDDR